MSKMYGVIQFQSELDDNALKEVSLENAKDIFKDWWQTQEQVAGVQLYDSLSKAMHAAVDETQRFMVYKVALESEQQHLSAGATLEKIRLFSAAHKRLHTFDHVSTLLSEFDAKQADVSAVPQDMLDFSKLDTMVSDTQVDSAVLADEVPSVGTDHREGSSSPAHPEPQPATATNSGSDELPTQEPVGQGEGTEPQPQKGIGTSPSRMPMGKKLLLGGSIALVLLSAVGLSPLGSAVLGASLLVKFGVACVGLLGLGGAFKAYNIPNESQQPSSEPADDAQAAKLQDLLSGPDHGAKDLQLKDDVDQAFGVQPATSTPQADCKKGCCGGHTTSAVNDADAADAEVERRMGIQKR